MKLTFLILLLLFISIGVKAQLANHNIIGVLPNHAQNSSLNAPTITFVTENVSNFKISWEAPTVGVPLSYKVYYRNITRGGNWASIVCPTSWLYIYIGHPVLHLSFDQFEFYVTSFDGTTEYPSATLQGTSGTAIYGTSIADMPNLGPVGDHGVDPLLNNKWIFEQGVPATLYRDGSTNYPPADADDWKYSNFIATGIVEQAEYISVTGMGPMPIGGNYGRIFIGSYSPGSSFEYAAGDYYTMTSAEYLDALKYPYSL